ncbi:KH domain-containing protein, partial [Patescibacteria group bacterium]|nr:KH domain-containing protein [Patescibacteria group bacterium]MBU1457291.1 KH domain-containing protein [Patescibacteria group bacterium]
MTNKKIQEIIENILGFLSLTDDQIKINFIDEDQIQVNISLPEDITGIFIGRGGENINALRLILSLIISQRTNTWPKLRLNVNDYQEKREEYLTDLAKDAAEKAQELQREIILPNLSSYERRIVHLHVESLGTVTTESRG